MLEYAKSWARRLAINSLAVVLLAAAPFDGVDAQNVVRQPAFIQSQQWLDLGNGPLDIQPVEGTGSIYSSLGTGIGSTTGSSTSLVLTAVPTVNIPCAGCIVSASSLGVAPVTITSFNGVTQIVLSSALTVPSNTALSWGVACPAATATNVPGVNPNTVTSIGSPLAARSGQNSTFPMYTQARLCAYGALQNGFTFLYFAIGAH